MKCFLEGPETHPNILYGDHRNQHQFKNALRIGGTGLSLYHMGLIVYQGAVCWRCNFVQHSSLNFVKRQVVEHVGSLHANLIGLLVSIKVRKCKNLSITVQI